MEESYNIVAILKMVASTISTEGLDEMLLTYDYSREIVYRRYQLGEEATWQLSERSNSSKVWFPSNMDSGANPTSPQR